MNKLLAIGIIGTLITVTIVGIGVYAVLTPVSMGLKLTADLLDGIVGPGKES